MLCCVLGTELHYKKRLKTKLNGVCNNYYSEQCTEYVVLLVRKILPRCEHKFIPPSPQNALSKSMPAFQQCSGEWRRWSSWTPFKFIELCNARLSLAQPTLLICPLSPPQLGKISTPTRYLVISAETWRMYLTASLVFMSKLCCICV